MNSLKTILTIAGSDPSGGAGIQADLKTFTVLGAYGAAVPTNLTVQNTLGVVASHPVEAELVHDQINCVLADLDVSHIKIGMIGSLEIAEAIFATIERFSGEVILDPVMQASDGSNLSDSLDPILRLIQKASIITPNWGELGMLSNTTPDSVESAITACKTLFGSFPKLRGIVCKGGHFLDNTTTVTDHFITINTQKKIEHYSQSHPRVKSSNTHGTGCTYASAFASYHQKHADYQQAFNDSSRFVYQLLKASAPFSTGKGKGGLLHHLHITSS